MKLATPLTAERDDPPESAAPLGTVSASETVPAKSVTTFPEASSTETAAEKFAPATAEAGGLLVTTTLEGAPIVVTLSVVGWVAGPFTLGT